MNEPVIRHAQHADVSEIFAIYNHYIVNTHITFHIEPLTLEQRVCWFEQFSDMGRHQCFVATLNSELIGWASSTPFKDRAAYETSVETSLYLAPQATGRGIGGGIYGTLMAALVRANVHRAYAFVSQPNPASVRLHERSGFVCMGRYHEVGRKFGRFWDVAVYERKMDSEPGVPILKFA